MRSIQVSTEVFAAIWAARAAGEDSEDAVLHRVFKLPAPVPSPTPISPPASVSGFVDLRYDVKLPEGFMIERTYKGQQVKAHATGGGWKLEHTGKTFASLRAMGDALGIGTENAWANWYFTDRGTGKRHPISNLRDPSKIIARSRK